MVDVNGGYDSKCTLGSVCESPALVKVSLDEVADGSEPPLEGCGHLVRTRQLETKLELVSSLRQGMPVAVLLGTDQKSNRKCNLLW